MFWDCLVISVRFGQNPGFHKHYLAIVPIKYRINNLALHIECTMLQVLLRYGIYLTNLQLDTYLSYKNVAQ